MQAQADGTNVVNALRVLNQVGLELDALIPEFEEKLTNLPRSGDFVFTAEHNARDSHYRGTNDWCFQGYHWRWIANRRQVTRGSDSRMGELCIGVDLGRDNGLARALSVPILFVTWTCDDDTWTSCLDHSEGEMWPIGSKDYSILAERLCVWHEEGENVDEVGFDARGRAWFFAVPLFAITDTAKLEILLLRPVLSLLGDDALNTAFFDAAEVIRFCVRPGDSMVRIEIVG